MNKPLFDRLAPLILIMLIDRYAKCEPKRVSKTDNPSSGIVYSQSRDKHKSKIVDDKTLSWIDLPKEKICNICKINNSFFRTLTHDIDQYHNIDKEDYSLLARRVEMLNKISGKVEHHIIECYDNKIDLNSHTENILRSINEISICKANYLKALIKLYYNGKSDADLKSELYLPDIRKGSITLTEDILYSPRKKKSIGHFWLEAVDPCHRDLKVYYDKWSQLKSKDKLTPRFFLWLETQIIPNGYMTVHYYTPSELEDKRKLTQAKYQEILSLNLKNGGIEQEYIFVVLPGFTIYASLTSKNIHHTSLSLGKPIIGAGNFTIKNGKMSKLFINSGHYLLPTSAYQRTIYSFYKSGISLDPTINLQMYLNSNIETKLLKDYYKHEQK